MKALENRDCAHDPQRLLEVLLGLAREADDDVGGDRGVGDLLADPVDDAEELRAAVGAAHRLEHPVGARLQRHVQARHDVGGLGHRGDDVVGERRRVRAGEPDPLEPVDLAAGAQQLAERQPVAELDAVGVDVLAEQGDLDDALVDERLRPRRGRRPGGGRPPCRAGSGRCRTCRCCCSPPRSRPSRRRPSRAGSAGCDGKTSRRLEDLDLRPRWLCRARSSRAGRQPMLWVPKTTSTQGARSTMVSRSFWAMQPPTAICMSGLRGLGRPQLAEVAVELVVGVLAHRAGVEDDDVGGVGPLGRGQAVDVDVAGRLEQAGEPLGVVHVHLAPVGAHVVGLLRRLCVIARQGYVAVHMEPAQLPPGPGPRTPLLTGEPRRPGLTSGMIWRTL